MIQVVASLVFLLSVIAYATPSIVAIWRAHGRWPMVVVIDVLLGWTVVGWLTALAMALDLRPPKPKPRMRPKAPQKRAPVDKPTETSAPTGDAAPVCERVDPPPVQEEAYARWLDGGAAMNA